MTSVFSITKEVFEGYPKLTVRVKIPPNFECTERDVEHMHCQWIAMYDKHPLFSLVIDITDESIGLFNTRPLLPILSEILNQLRPRTERQVVLTGVLSGPVSEALIFIVTKTYYEPIRPFTYSSDSIVLRTDMRKMFRTDAKVHHVIANAKVHHVIANAKVNHANAKVNHASATQNK